MTLALLTQRVTVDPRHGERRDALDQRWHPWLAAAGMRGLPLANAQPEEAGAWLDRLAPDLIILTGGNGIDGGTDAADAAPERDAFERALLDAALAARIPVLGICRGLQMLNRYFGGTLMRVAGHAGTRHAVAGPGVAATEVNSYHDWGIARPGLAAELIAMALDDTGHVEAVRHASRPVAGLMWHPERATTAGERARDTALIREWLPCGR